MSMPESPAVQDTDRLREVAAEALDAHLDQWLGAPVSATGILADAVLAAVLPVHRAQVLEEATTAITDNVRNEDWSKQDRGGFYGIAPKMAYVAGHDKAAALIRRLAASTPPTPPSATESVERAAPGETDTAGRQEVSWAEARAIATEELLRMEARRAALADREAAAFPGETGTVERAGRFEELLAAEHEQFDPRGEVLRSVVEYADAPTLAASTPAAAVPGTGDDPPSVRDRALLGAARRLLDQVAETEAVQNADPDLARKAADVAQRIVDEIGHPVTDEPALGPSHREQIAVLIAARRGLSAELAKFTAPPGTPTYEQLLRSHAKLLDQQDEWRKAMRSLGEEFGQDTARLEAERDRLAETIRRYEPVIEAAKAWLAYGWNGSARLTAAIRALGDIPSPTAPQAPVRTEEEWTMRYLLNGKPQLAEQDGGHIFDDLPDAQRHLAVWRRVSPTLDYADVEYLRRTVTYGPWTCPAPVEPEGTPDADA